MAGIEIKDDQLTKIMAQAVLTFLTPEKREELLAKAVEQLFMQKNNTYDKTTLIEAEFFNAIRSVGGEVARDIIRNDKKIMDRIRAACYEGINQKIDDPKFVDHIADAMKRALGGGF